MQVWEQLQQRLAAAQALQLDARMELSDSSIAPEEMQAVKMQIQLKLARPGHGTASWTTVFGEGEEAETVVIDWIGTGDKVYAVDHEDKVAFVEGAEWKDSEFGYFLPFLGPSWCSGSLEVREVSPLPPPAEHPDWRGLKVLGAAPPQEDDVDDSLEGVPEEVIEMQVWLAPDGAIRRAVTSLGDTAKMSFEIDLITLSEKADLEKFRMTMPEGYEILDEAEESPAEEEFSLDGSLLPVGAQAPEALLIGLDDVEFTLSSLQGKTVLLNFWFFH